MNELYRLLRLIKDKPIASGLLILLLSGGSGASIGAFATKSVVDDKHHQAMVKIDALEEDRDQMQRQLNRIEDKIDRILERGYGRR